MNPNTVNPLPDPGPGRNPPQYRKPDSDSWGMGAILALVFAGIVVVGGLWYASGYNVNRTVSNPPPITTGQGGAPVNLDPPVAPRMIPTPAPFPDPVAPSKQGEDLEVAPSTPVQPLTNN